MYENGTPLAKKFIQKNTKIEITRDVYQGIETFTDDGVSTGIYFKDKLSVTIFGQELNEIPVQSLPDAERKFPLSEGDHTGEVGVDGATSPYIKDGIQIDGGEKFIHANWKDGKKLYSEGCPMTYNEADMQEVRDIIYDDLGYEKTDKIDISVENSESE